VHETLNIRHPDGKWADRYGQARPLVNLNKTFYDIKGANRDCYKEIFDLIVNDLGLQASIASPSLFFSDNFSQENGVLIPVYLDDIRIIGQSGIVASIAS